MTDWPFVVPERCYRVSSGFPLEARGNDGWPCYNEFTLILRLRFLARSAIMHAHHRFLALVVFAWCLWGCAPSPQAAPPVGVQPARTLTTASEQVPGPAPSVSAAPPTLATVPATPRPAAATATEPAATALATGTAASDGPSSVASPTSTSMPSATLPAFATLPPPTTGFPTATPPPRASATALSIGTVAAATAIKTNIELAHDRLQAEPMQTTLIIVSSASTGLEGLIYQDMRTRVFRSTTGPDEGIDTHSLSCYPNCVFVPSEEVNVLTVGVWMLVLRHEYRHMVQASHNPNLAADFRGPDGRFTSYAAFSEACADYGLNVAPVYRAQVRIDQLRAALGASRQPLIDQACQGDKPSYDQVMQMYDAASVGGGMFSELFPTYR